MENGLALSLCRKIITAGRRIHYEFALHLTNRLSVRWSRVYGSWLRCVYHCASQARGVRVAGLGVGSGARILLFAIDSGLGVPAAAAAQEP